MILLSDLQTSECQELVHLSLKWILFPSIYILNYFFLKKFLMANFALIDSITLLLTVFFSENISKMAGTSCSKP